MKYIAAVAIIVAGLLLVLFTKSKPQQIERDYPDYEDLDNIYDA